MATTEHASDQVESLRRELAQEREQLAADIAVLRGGVDLTSRVRARLPLLAAAGFTAGFVIAGGIGATARLLMRRSREGREVARYGRYVIVDRG
jgi:hypothetical protein